jgi:Domain of unknown function (DUF6468)
MKPSPMAGLASADLFLQLSLIVLLIATLFYTIRLEHAIGVLKRDKIRLEHMSADFTASTQQAEAGILRLRAAADGTGRQIAQQIDSARTVQRDLEFLIGRGERIADRFDAHIRTQSADIISQKQDVPRTRLRSQAEKDLLKALKLTP